MFIEKSNGANLAPAKYMHVMYKCRVSLVGGGGWLPQKYINKNHHFPATQNPKLKCFRQPKRHHIEHAGFLIRLQKNHTLIFINIYFSLKCMGIGISPILRQLKPIFMDITL